MAHAYVVTWNPAQWPWDDDDYAEVVRRTTLGKLFSGRWSSGNRKSIHPGDRLFLVRQGSERGLIGSGVATSESYYDAHWDKSRDTDALYVNCQFDTLIDADDRLPVEQLLQTDLGVPWNNLYASGVRVPDKSVKRLERLWQQHLVRIGRSVSDDMFTPLADQESSSEAWDAGANDEIERVLRQIVQRRGQPEFRERVLAAYGGLCAITGCDAKAALEAAHIEPYRGPSSNVVTNGLLLRSDIHTLFDLGLIAVVPDKLTIKLAQELKKTAYGELNGKRLRLPKAPKHRPSAKALTRRWKWFIGQLPLLSR